jgi:hypothetical protein
VSDRLSVPNATRTAIICPAVVNENEQMPGNIGEKVLHGLYSLSKCPHAARVQALCYLHLHCSVLLRAISRCAAHQKKSTLDLPHIDAH